MPNKYDKCAYISERTDVHRVVAYGRAINLESRKKAEEVAKICTNSYNAGQRAKAQEIKEAINA